MKTHTIRRDYVNPEYLPEQERDARGFNLTAETVYLVEFSLAEFVRGKHPAEHRDALIYCRRPLVPFMDLADALARGERPEQYAGPEAFRVVAYCNRATQTPEFPTARAALRFAVQEQLQPGGAENPNPVI